MSESILAEQKNNEKVERLEQIAKSLREFFDNPVELAELATTRHPGDWLIDNTDLDFELLFEYAFLICAN